MNRIVSRTRPVLANLWISFPRVSAAPLLVLLLLLLVLLSLLLLLLLILCGGGEGVDVVVLLRDGEDISVLLLVVLLLVGDGIAGWMGVDPLLLLLLLPVEIGLEIAMVL